MTDEHWFDAMSKLATHGSPRRGVLSAVVAMMSAHRLGAIDTMAKNGRKGGKDKKKRKKDKKKKDKDKRKPDPSCEPVCIQEYELFPEEIPACVDKCNACRIRDNFCVIGRDPNKVATCCFEGDQCCQETHACCPMDSVCCPGYPQTSPLPCCPTDQDCCPSDIHGCCSGGETCCPGEGCVLLSLNQRNCGICDNRCPQDQICTDGHCLPVPPGGCPGLTLCDGYCVDTERDPSHCGQCRKICRDGQSCTNGRCEPEGWECCETDRGPVCTYTTGPNAQDPWHCGACGYICPGNQACISGHCRCEEPSTWCSAQQRCLLGLPC